MTNPHTEELKRREAGVYGDPEERDIAIVTALNITAFLASEGAEEALARMISPSSWRVMDSYLTEVKRKYKGEDAGYDPDAFKDHQSMELARALIELLAEKGCG